MESRQGLPAAHASGGCDQIFTTARLAHDVSGVWAIWRRALNGEAMGRGDREVVLETEWCSRLERSASHSRAFVVRRTPGRSMALAMFSRTYRAAMSRATVLLKESLTLEAQMQVIRVFQNLTL